MLCFVSFQFHVWNHSHDNDPYVELVSKNNKNMQPKSTSEETSNGNGGVVFKINELVLKLVNMKHKGWGTVPD